MVKLIAKSAAIRFDSLKASMNGLKPSKLDEFIELGIKVKNLRVCGSFRSIEMYAK